METFSALLAICAGNSPVLGEFPTQRQVMRTRGALMFSLICARINGWVNNPEAGDLRSHRSHYDVTVMNIQYFMGQHNPIWMAWPKIVVPPLLMHWRYLCHQPSHQGVETRARFLSLAQSKLRLCSANHRAGNLACDWLSIVWAYSEQETENGPRTFRENHVSIIQIHGY